MRLLNQIRECRIPSQIKLMIQTPILGIFALSDAWIFLSVEIFVVSKIWCANYENDNRIIVCSFKSFFDSITTNKVFCRVQQTVFLSFTHLQNNFKASIKKTAVHKHYYSFAFRNMPITKDRKRKCYKLTKLIFYQPIYQRPAAMS